MGSRLDDFDFECPQCGTRVDCTFADVAAGRTKRCRRGHAVKLHDDGGGFRNADSAMKHFDKALRRLGG
jgi:hypothetical protein